MFGVQKWCASIDRNILRTLVEQQKDLEAVSNGASMRAPPDETRMVKKFRRAAAGIDEQLPSDLRPPLVLQVCCAGTSSAYHVDPYRKQLTTCSTL